MCIRDSLFSRSGIATVLAAKGASLLIRLNMGNVGPVSYTHLDVYKRQALYRPHVPAHIKEEDFCSEADSCDHGCRHCGNIFGYFRIRMEVRIWLWISIRILRIKRETCLLYTSRCV